MPILLVIFIAILSGGVFGASGYFYGKGQLRQQKEVSELKCKLQNTGQAAAQRAQALLDSTRAAKEVAQKLEAIELSVKQEIENDRAIQQIKKSPPASCTHFDEPTRRVYNSILVIPAQRPPGSPESDGVFASGAKSNSAAANTEAKGPASIGDVLENHATNSKAAKTNIDTLEACQEQLKVYLSYSATYKAVNDNTAE